MFEEPNLYFRAEAVVINGVIDGGLKDLRSERSKESDLQNLKILNGKKVELI